MGKQKKKKDKIIFGNFIFAVPNERLFCYFCLNYFETIV